MRFATAEEHGGKTVLTIPDPCANEDALKRIQDVTAYRCENGKTVNATHTASGRIAMAVLQNPRACKAEELKEVLAQCKRQNGNARREPSGRDGRHLREGREYCQININQKKYRRLLKKWTRRQS